MVHRSRRVEFVLRSGQPRRLGDHHRSPTAVAIMILQRKDHSAISECCLTYGWQWKSFAIASAFASLLLVAWVATRADQMWHFAFGFVILFSGSMVVPLILEFYVVRISWDNSQIYTSSPWRRPRAIPRSAILSCDFSIWAQWYRVHTAGYGTVRVHRYMSGIPEFLCELPCVTPSYPPPTTFQ